ncbi:MAG TPA: cation:proton antiporter [Candidatus Paceibacterota bacterium]|nr:cation:proton antiporter [Candidatus Paceibacterota bacterium]
MEIFIELGLILLVATLVSFVMRLLKQPLVVGYILTGIIVGPYFLNFVGSGEYVEVFSKFGVAILLFIIGLHLKADTVKEVGKAALITGLGQIVFTSVIGFLILQALGFDFTVSLYGSLALTFSSTIIVLKLLSDRGDLGNLYGKVSIGFLLVQDIFATLVLLFITVWGSSSAETNVLEMTGFLFLKGMAFFILLYLASKYVLPRLLHFLASSQELLFLFSLAWGIGLAIAFSVFGFSIEIGALFAGVALAASPFAQEIGSRMKPLRDFFILLFFVMLGSEMILSDLGAILGPAVILSFFVLIGNPIIVIILMNLLGYKSRTGFMAGLTVAQISEFSLILMALGLSFGHFGREAVSLVTLVGIVTIAGSTYLILYADKIYPKIRPFLRMLEWRKVPKKEEGGPAEAVDIAIFGYDRVGHDFVQMANKLNKKFYVVDFNPESIKKLINKNIPYYYGDAEDVDFLDEIEAASAKMVISTIPGPEDALALTRYYRSRNSDGVLIVMCHNIKEALGLYNAGATFVVMPHYLGAQYASERIEKWGIMKEKADWESEKAKHLEYLENRKKFTEE